MPVPKLFRMFWKGKKKTAPPLPLQVDAMDSPAQRKQPTPRSRSRSRTGRRRHLRHIRRQRIRGADQGGGGRK